MVKRAASLEEAWDILDKHCAITDEVDDEVSLDEEGRVNITGTITFRRRGQTEFPLWFGKVTGNFYAEGLALRSLEGAPYEVGKSFILKQNNLSTLVGGPQRVGAYYNVLKNPLVNLDGLATSIGDAFSFSYTPTLPLLRTLAAKRIWPNPDQVELEKILEKYAGQGRAGAIDCKRALVAAGFEGNARW